MCITDIVLHIHIGVIHMALTDKAIQALQATDKTQTYTDGLGLALEVPAKGSKRWRFRYRFNNKPKLVSFGTYPEVSLKQARMKRDDSRTQIASGIDPFPSKVIHEVIHSQDKTFQYYAEYWETKVQNDLSQTHIDRTKKGFKADVFPYIGDMLINDIRAKDIINIVNVMAERGAKESAKKIFSSISRVFQIAMANYPDDIERNPTRDIKLVDVLGKGKETHYPIITEAKELGILLNAIDSYTGHTSTKLALKMITNTFVRPHNIRHAEWSEINLDTKQWIIPPSKMKTKKELIVPLSKQVLEILEDAKALNTAGLVFPSTKSKTTPMSDAAMVGALRRLGYATDEIVAHSFRGIFSTIAHEKALYGHEVIETQLAHSVGTSVSQAYNRAVYLKERTEMMQWYSDLLQGYKEKKC